MRDPRARRAFAAAVLAAALAPGGTARAYDTRVHEKMTAAAFYGSRLYRDPKVLSRLGLDPFSAFPNESDEPRSILGLLEEGSVSEDDGIRPLNHFFDPISGLGVSGLANPSPDWALEDRSEFTGLLLDQRFSFRDARQDFFDALTWPKKSDRDALYGHLFRTLGHVVHHVQDMAQPQHVRNDPHLDSESANLLCPPPGLNPLCVLYWAVRNPSAFEQYTRAHPDRAEPTEGYAQVWTPDGPFDTPRSFWQRGGKGLAEFTNRNFVSAGTNFRSGKYTSPQEDPARTRDFEIEALCKTFPGTPCPSVTGTLTMFGTTVDDALSGVSEPNEYASTLSVFDADLTKKGRSPVFSLNRFNFEAALRFLVPRAVGYSAGLLDYFFRASIDFVEDPDSRGFLVKNASPDLLHGTFALYYDAADDTRKPVPGAKWTLTLAGTPDPEKPVSSQPLDFAPPADAKTKGRYVLVFSGDEGDEVAGAGALGAVAGKIVDVRHVPEGLFVAGLDAAGKTVYLRADATGTHVLGPGDFNPLVNAPLPAASPSSAVYKMRQASFGGAAPGYLTTAVAFRNKPLGGGTYLVGGSLVYDAPNRSYSFQSDASWGAVSPDPALGRFVFTYHVVSGAITWTRRWVDATGTNRFDGGLLTIPPALLTYNQVNLSGIDQGKVFVSPDGLSLRGFAKTISSPTTTTTTGGVTTTTFSIDRVEGELLLALSASPTASLSETTVRQVNTRGTSSQFQEEIGSFTTNAPANCFDPRDPYTCTFANVHFYHSNVTHQDQHTTTPIGWFDGAFATYAWDYTSDVDQLTDYTGANCTMALPVEYGCCAPVYYWVRAEYSGSIHDERTADATFAFPVGALAGRKSHTWIYDDRNHHFEGCYQDAPDFPPQVNETTYSETTITRALTPNAADAVIASRANLGSGYRTYFRGIDLTPFSWLADASPLGEVFFATSDKSILVHEPRGGRMPAIVIPPTVVTLLGALWM